MQILQILSHSNAKFKMSQFSFVELEQSVQSSQHGVVVISFGSYVNFLAEEIIIKMIRTFQKRKELYIMR